MKRIKVLISYEIPISVLEANPGAMGVFRSQLEEYIKDVEGVGMEKTELSIEEMNED